MKRLLPFSLSDALQFIKLLFRIPPCFCVVDELIHQSPFPMCTWKIIGACGTERRVSREDRPNLADKEGQSSERMRDSSAYRKVFWQAFYPLALAIVLPVESFGVQLIP